MAAGTVQSSLRGGLGPAQLLIALQAPLRVEQACLRSRKIGPGGSGSDLVRSLLDEEKFLILGDEPSLIEAPDLDEPVDACPNIDCVLGFDASD